MPFKHDFLMNWIFETVAFWDVKASAFWDILFAPIKILTIFYMGSWLNFQDLKITIYRERSNV